MIPAKDRIGLNRDQDQGSSQAAPSQPVENQPPNERRQHQRRRDNNITLMDMLTKPLSPLPPLQNLENDSEQFVLPLDEMHQNLETTNEPVSVLIEQVPNPPYFDIQQNVSSTEELVEPVNSLPPQQHQPSNLIQRIQQPQPCIHPKDFIIPFTPVTVQETVPGTGEIRTTVINTCGMTNLPYTLRDDDPFDTKYPHIRTPLPPISTFLKSHQNDQKTFPQNTTEHKIIPPIECIIPELRSQLSQSPLKPLKPSNHLKNSVRLISANELIGSTTKAPLPDLSDSDMEPIPGPSGYHVIPPSSSTSKQPFSRPKTKADLRAARALRAENKSLKISMHPSTSYKISNNDPISNQAISITTSCSQSYTTDDQHLITSLSKLRTEDVKTASDQQVTQTNDSPTFPHQKEEFEENYQEPIKIIKSLKQDDAIGMEEQRPSQL